LDSYKNKHGDTIMGLLEIFGLKKYKPTSKDILIQQKISEYIKNFVPDIDQKESIRKTILEIGDIFEGTKEIGKTNRGYWVSRFQKDLHLDGYAWCLSYIQFVYKTASELHRRNFDILPFNTAGTQRLWNWAFNRGYTFLDYKNLRPADLIIWRNGMTNFGHVEFSVFSNDNMVITNGGNTNSAFSRDGGLVAKKEFNILRWGEIGKQKKIDRFVRGFISFDKLYQASAF
jgi:hypothetical protein